MPFDGSKLDEVTKILIEGRERIEQGWCQGGFRRYGAVCMLAAIGWPSDASIGAARRLEKVIGYNRIVAWNDAPERTKDEVLAAYDRAIAAA